MSAWPDTAGAAIDGYVRQLRLRHPKTSVIYRSELRRFQRFIEANEGLRFESVSAWLRSRAEVWPMHLVVDRACKVDRFLNFMAEKGILDTHPFAELRACYGQRRLSPIIHAILSKDPPTALEVLRPLPRFGSFLGALMRDHIELRRSLGYRYVTQAERFAEFDRFLQSRSDLNGKEVPTLLHEWQSAATTLEQRWARELAGRDLTKACSHVDPNAPRLAPDRNLRRRVMAERRRPYIYSQEQVLRILETASQLSSPRSPLRPLTIHTMLMLAYCAGLRIGEIIRLDLRDVSWDDGTITIRNSKFFKSRRLPLTDSVLSALRGYADARARSGAPLGPSAPLLWRQSREGGGRYARITAANLIVRVLRQAGLKPACGRRGPRLHDLRHSFVAHRMLDWYRKGVNPQAHLPYLATFLGHRDINSTLVYLNTTPELLQLASNRFRSYVEQAGTGRERRLP